jgi:hypothetical protein
MSYDYAELERQLAHTETLDDGRVRLGDGRVVYEYEARQLRSRLATHRGEVTRRARLAAEARRGER